MLEFSLLMVMFVDWMLVFLMIVWSVAWVKNIMRGRKNEMECCAHVGGAKSMHDILQFCTGNRDHDELRRSSKIAVLLSSRGIQK
jgi:hypothetical protein